MAEVPRQITESEAERACEDLVKSGCGVESRQRPFAEAIVCARPRGEQLGEGFGWAAVV